MTGICSLFTYRHCLYTFCTFCVYILFSYLQKTSINKGGGFRNLQRLPKLAPCMAELFCKVQTQNAPQFQSLAEGKPKVSNSASNLYYVRPYGLSLYRYMKTTSHKRTEPQFVLPCSFECINLRLLARRHLTVAGQFFCHLDGRTKKFKDNWDLFRLISPLIPTK